MRYSLFSLAMCTLSLAGQSLVPIWWAMYWYPSLHAYFAMRLNNYLLLTMCIVIRFLNCFAHIKNNVWVVSIFVLQINWNFVIQLCFPPFCSNRSGCVKAKQELARRVWSSYPCCTDVYCAVSQNMNSSEFSFVNFVWPRVPEHVEFENPASSFCAFPALVVWGSSND